MVLDGHSVLLFFQKIVENFGKTDIDLLATRIPTTFRPLLSNKLFV